MSEPTFPAGFTIAPVVLVVDDEPNIVSSLRRLLRPSGYRILTANGGEEALGVLEQDKADLVISDMRMPGMDGAELLTRVRQRWPDTLRILLTGYADIQSTVAAINQGGIHRYMSKPWNDEEMLSVVARALELRGLQLENQRLNALTLEQNEALNALNQSLEDKVRERTAELERSNAELSVAHEKLRKSFMVSVQIFSNLMELRAGPLAGHSRRVAELSRKIAVSMELPRQEQQDVMVAALLHDIGKIGLPDALLAKPVAAMTGDELGLMRKHPAKGGAALMALDELKNAARIIRHHHERFDGKGYPDALSGLGIPLGARILALVNDYDGAQIGIPFARKYTADEARDWIIQGRASRYDPAVVDAFIGIVGAPPPPPGKERRITTADLKPGMVLARDLCAADGTLLLAADFLLDENLVRQIQEFEAGEARPLTLWIRP